MSILLYQKANGSEYNKKSLFVCLDSRIANESLGCILLSSFSQSKPTEQENSTSNTPVITLHRIQPSIELDRMLIDCECMYPHALSPVVCAMLLFTLRVNGYEDPFKAHHSGTAISSE